MRWYAQVEGGACGLPMSTWYYFLAKARRDSIGPQDELCHLEVAPSMHVTAAVAMQSPARRTLG